MTSGYTDTITPQDAYDAGIVDFLLKPLQLQQVADSIENAIGIFIK
jgi:FixJ family two-component response regulator